MLGVSVHYPTLSEYEQAALNGVLLKQVIIRCEIRDAAGRVVADGVGARALQQDSGDINKALKMAEKSAHIDATLRMAGLSEVFTQDLEEMIPAGNATIPGSATSVTTHPSSHAGKPAASSSPSPQAGDPSGSVPPVRQNGTTINPAQRKRLETRISALGLERERVKAWLHRASRGRVQGFDQLTPAMYQTLDKRLETWAQHTAIQEANP